MRLLRTTLIAFTLLLSINCASKSEKEVVLTKESTPTVKNQKKYETAYFAAGCFWCVEAIFESVKGVKEVVSGYAGGVNTNPTYVQVGGGHSKHAEAIAIYYNPEVVSYATLVKVFFGSHDPTTLNRQGPDKGPQYRSIAFYKNDTEKKTINNYIKSLTTNKVYRNKIVTEVTAYATFYKAEDYHQDYEKRHPNNPYVKNVSIPRLNKFKSKFPKLLKEGKH